MRDEDDQKSDFSFSDTIREIENQLFGLVRWSRDHDVKLAASNAASLLCAAGVAFRGRDLRGAQLSNARLHNGVFDDVKFDECDLTGCVVPLFFLSTLFVPRVHNLRDRVPGGSCRRKSRSHPFSSCG